MIVKEIDSPILIFPSFSKLGVTVMFEVIGDVVVLVDVISIFPVPELDKPISELSFVQAYVVAPPVTIDENSTNIVSSLHTNWSSAGFT